MGGGRGRHSRASRFTGSGTVTGLSTPALEGKQLQLLQEAVPTLSRVAVLSDATNSEFRREPYDATAGAYMLRGLLTCACCDGPLACEVTRARRSDGTRRTYRYYQCGRSKRGWARTHQRDQCPMTQVPAADMDALAWDVIRETLLDPEQLRLGLATAQVEYTLAHARRAEQVAALDQALAQRRARLSRILDEQLDSPAGSETARLLAEKARQLEQQIHDLQADQERRAAEPHAGLSERQAQSLAGLPRRFKRALPWRPRPSGGASARS